MKNVRAVKIFRQTALGNDGEYDNHGEGSSPRQAVHDKQQQLNADESDDDMLVSPNDQAVDQSKKDPKNPKKNMAR